MLENGVNKLGDKQVCVVEAYVICNVLTTFGYLSNSCTFLFGGESLFFIHIYC
ncbi:hypothetical protein Hanom_Chr10g00927101 [Helianthus anomalus]